MDKSMEGSLLTQIELDKMTEQYSHEQKEEIIQYIGQLDDVQKKAFLIAKSHLGTSFHVLRSNGFKEWKASLAGK